MIGVRRLAVLTLLWCCAVLGGLLSWSAPALAQRMHAFSSSFSGAGSGNGQLLRPGGVAVNEKTGDVYVIDRGNSRVEIFNSGGGYVGQFDGSASPQGPFSWSYSEQGAVPEGAIAVDNSSDPSDPSRGDVYVTDEIKTVNPVRSVIFKFSASGAYIGDILGISSTQPFEATGFGPAGIAIDPDGNVWVKVKQREFVEFNDALSNAYVSSVDAVIPTTEFAPPLGNMGVAVDSHGDLYASVKPELFERYSYPTEFSKRGEALIERLDSEETRGFTVDFTSDDAYVDHESAIAAYSPVHRLVERFGSPQLQKSEGVAANSRTGAIFASDATTGQVDVFSSFVVPDATTGSASISGEMSATLSGAVNPDGMAVTSCVFEYGTSESYGQSAPCEQSSTQIGSGSQPVPVSARLSGLKKLTVYHYRLVVANTSGANYGQDATFTTPEAPIVSEEVVSDVSAGSALFSAQVNPMGADTRFRFEYGLTTSYDQSVPAPEGDAGAGTSAAPVSARVEGLAPSTVYHVRVVASNMIGTVHGPDMTFTTQPGGSAFALPDGRQWEMVSPPGKEGALIEAINQAFPLGTPSLIQAAAEGGAISYYANGPFGEGSAGSAPPFRKTQLLSRRAAGGWSTQDITLPQRTVGASNVAEYAFFSSDLSRAIVELHAGNGELLPSEPPASEETPYFRNDENGSYAALVSAANVPPGTEFSPVTSQAPRVAAATPDLSHAVIFSRFALTANAVTASAGTNIYEWSAGQLQLVNELPGGTVTAGAEFGGASNQNTRRALSDDGSRVFFQTGVPGALDMRNTLARQTVPVDEPASGVKVPPEHRAEFQVASADGARVFFTDEEPLTSDSTLQPVGAGSLGPRDLYAFDSLTGSLTDLSVDHNAGEQAEVQTLVLGASEDGSVVYFVARGKLAGGAQAGQENLYVESLEGSSWLAPRLVAVPSEEDGPDWAGFNTGGTFVSTLTSRVSPSGRYLAFMSERPLTGYDNRDALSGALDEEVFVYDRAGGQLTCVSCDPTGARPAGLFEGGEQPERPFADKAGAWPGRWLAGSIPGWTVPVETEELNASYQSRVLSDEGRLFFNATGALVPQDTNGRGDVYEYEPQGVGGCAQATGCVALISSGTSSEESAFLDASATGPEGHEGEDVFFLTQSALVPQDVDTSFDVYDAHICSSAAPCVSPPVVLPECRSADACKAAPALQPELFGAGPTETLNGAGNLAPAPAPLVKPRSLTAAQKLARALRVCRKKKNKRKRAVCERQAKRRYGAKHARRARATTNRGAGR